MLFRRCWALAAAPWRRVPTWVWVQEVTAGWIRAGAKHPHSLPVHIAPFNARDKTRGRVRLMADASWPVPTAELADLEGVP